MKQFIYKVKEKGFSGEIVLDVPSYKEKLAIIKSLNMKVSKDGIEEASVDPMEMAEKLFETMEKYVKKVDLEYAGEKFSSVDELGYYEVGQKVIQEIQHVLTNGMALGKK